MKGASEPLDIANSGSGLPFSPTSSLELVYSDYAGLNSMT